MQMTILFALLQVLSRASAAEIPQPQHPPSPKILFESLVMGDDQQTPDGRPWSLICGTLGDARGTSFSTSMLPDFPPQFITTDLVIKSPFPLDFTPYIGRYICFYKITGDQSTGYFAITTHGNSFYKTPLSTMRFSAEFNAYHWPDTVKKVSFFYNLQHIGTLKKDTPNIDGRHSLNESFPNPESHYIDPERITFTIHYDDKSKSEGHTLNPANFTSRFKQNLSDAGPLTQVPHAIRFILSFDQSNLNVSYRGHFDLKQSITTPSRAIFEYAQPDTPENDEGILDSLHTTTDHTYVFDTAQAQKSDNYPTYLDLARDYMKQASRKYNIPVHIPTALRTLRSKGLIPASSYLGLILLDLQKELNQPPENVYYPAPLT
jgi:hypothetical protein